MTVSLTGHPGRNTQDKGGEDRRRHEGDGDSHARRRALGGAAHAVAGGAATGHRCAVAQQRCTAEHERDRRPQREHIAHGVVPRPDLSALAKHLSNEQTTGEQTDEVPDPPDDDVASATDESGGLDIGAAGTERLVGHDEETDNQQTEDRTTDEPRQPVRKGIEHVQCLSSGERGEIRPTALRGRRSRRRSRRADRRRRRIRPRRGGWHRSTSGSHRRNRRPWASRRRARPACC